MDFFREQDIARRNTRLLVALFIAAVTTLMLLANALVMLTLFTQTGGDPALSVAERLRDSISWQQFGAVTLVIGIVVGVVVMTNWLRFSQGGKTVAEALGARPALPNSDDPLEQRAQNIVQEISLAANMPVPPLYILDDERGINAFAAGITPADAVVAITRGAMRQLNRDELQGVIGHEFSHILNGDMRLSLRLAAMLRGITFLGDIGGVVLRSASYQQRRHNRNKKSDNGAGLLVLGLGLYVIGFLGGLMAGMIKSAISKQKEYLADASAVQFTRNPEGVANALKVIGGYTPGTLVHSARAEELSHLFFGQVRHRLWSLFATHPPLEQRIRRIDPAWDGAFIQRANAVDSDTNAGQSGLNDNPQADKVAGIAALAAIDLTAPPIEVPAPPTLDEPSPPLADGLIKDAREPLNAMAMVLGLLWSDSARDKQLAALSDFSVRGLEPLVVQYGRELESLTAEAQFMVIEICLPSLKLMSPQQFVGYKRTLLGFIRADGRIDLFEWCLFQLVRHYLDADFALVKASKPRYSNLSDLAPQLTIILATLAALSTEDTEQAFRRGAIELGLPHALPQLSHGVSDFGKAVAQAADLYPLLKVKLLKAMALVAGHDGIVCAKEFTLIKAVAAVIDCPTPDHLLPATLNSTPQETNQINVGD